MPDDKFFFLVKVSSNVEFYLVREDIVKIIREPSS